MLFHFNTFYNFFIAEKRLQWNLNTKIKYFMIVFHISWNAHETVFHEMLWKKSFPVYPRLYTFQEQLRTDIAAQNSCGRVVVLKIYQRPGIKDNDQRYQLVPCYDVSQTSVSYKYELKCLWDVLCWSVSVRYQLVHRYDVSNWSVLLTYQWRVAKASKIGQFIDVPVETSWWCLSMVQDVQIGNSNGSISFGY